jgi:glycerol uptake facilitator-like aquaporin
MPRAFPYLATKVCNILAPFAMEFGGTFFLVAAVGFNSVSAHPLAPLGIGLTLVVCVFAGGHISGSSSLPP